MSIRFDKLTIITLVAGAALLGACGDDADGGGTSATTSSGQGGGTQTSTTSGSTTGNGGGGGALQCGASQTKADCADYCTGAVAAACPGGPTQQECEQSCAMLNDFGTQCPAWGALVDCGGTSPTFVCIQGEQVPEGCELEFFCLSQCFK